MSPRKIQDVLLEKSSHLLSGSLARSPGSVYTGHTAGNTGTALLLRTIKPPGRKKKTCNYVKDIHLHHPSGEKRLAFLFREHLLFMMTLPQHQEAERAEHGGDQQRQENVLPAAV